MHQLKYQPLPAEREKVPGLLTLTNFGPAVSEAASPNRCCSHSALLPLHLAGRRRGLARSDHRFCTLIDAAKTTLKLPMLFPISGVHVDPLYLIVCGFVIGILGGFFGVGGSFLA